MLTAQKTAFGFTAGGNFSQYTAHNTVVTYGYSISDKKFLSPGFNVGLFSKSSLSIIDVVNTVEYLVKRFYGHQPVMLTQDGINKEFIDPRITNHYLVYSLVFQKNFSNNWFVGTGLENKFLMKATMNAHKIPL
jgi:hypothetical protein